MLNRTLSALFALVILFANGRILNAQEQKAQKAPESRDTINVDSNESLPSLRITGKLLYLAGKITGDVHATNSAVVIRPGGKIEGTLYLRGGSLQNQTTDSVSVAAQPAPVAVSAAPEALPASGIPSSSSAASPEASFGASVTPMVNTNLVMTGGPEASFSPNRSQARKDWFGAQMALLILGLLAGAVIRIAAPRAASRAAATVGIQPGRCLLVGAASVVALGMVSLMNVGVMASPLKFLWLPVGFAVASGVLVLLAFGWLCGMRAMGEVVAAKSCREGNGDFFVRMALGLSVFFLLNTLLGGIGSWLGAIGLMTQFVVSVMGLGAAVITGLGRSDNWLGAKMRRG